MLLPSCQSTWSLGKNCTGFSLPPSFLRGSKSNGPPRPFDDDHLKKLGEGLALSPKHLVHHEMLKLRKGLLIFSVCPFSLLVRKQCASLVDI